MTDPSRAQTVDTDIAQQKIELLLEQCAGVLCSEAIGEVRHYVDHGEPEMAFEGLSIELMQTGKIPELSEIQF